jgi:eukaryotic-like serine/threonine-protein kinase
MNPSEISPAHAQELGKYRLIAKLARGGMGDVYLAVAQGPGGFHKLVAVKEMRPDFAGDERYVAMFLEEARLAARLAHPNIVQTYEIGTDGGRHFMTMEYLEGRSLYRVHKQLSSRGGLPVGAHLRVIAEALLGLHYAHELRGFDGEALAIVHRDVSPLNVFVTFDGQAKLLDFGIAKAADSSLETQAGVLKGRLAYMAPEQATGGAVDRRADLYAVGVMIWEAVAGRRMWPGLSDVEIFTRALGDGPPALLAVCPGAPPELAAICARALARRPDDRFPTAAALLEDLDRHLRRRHDAVSMRELGALVSGAFEPERRQMNATIEEALAHLHAGPQSGVMTARSTGAARPSRIDSTRPTDPPEDIANLASFLGATPSRAPASEQRPRPTSARPPLPTIAEGMAPGRRRRRMWIIVAGGAAALGVGAGVAMVRGGLGATVRVSEPPRATMPAPEPVSVGAPESALAPSASAPALKAALAPERPPTTAPSLVALAPAIQRPKVVKVVVAPAAPAVPAPAPAPPTTTAPRTEIDPPVGRAPLHPIVTTNPYGSP